jgi:hypothetical protein
MHDTTIDHTRVTMLKFINSVWHKKWVVWHINMWSVIFLIYNFMNIPHYEHSLETWKVSLLLLCAAPCILRRNSTRKLPSMTNCNNFIPMKYTFACGMISITKHCVTFKFNFHNGMKTTITLSHDHVAWLSFRIACRTHQDKHLYIYQIQSVNKPL